MGTRFLWDPIEDNIVKELDDSSVTVADYTTEPYLYGDLISQDRSGQSRFYHFDGLGSTMELTDGGGVVTDTRRYSAFGETTERTGSTDFPFQYLGLGGYYHGPVLEDASVRHRVYSPHASRWLSSDPLGLSPGVNAYRYVDNNPSNTSDYSGLASMPHGHKATTVWAIIDPASKWPPLYIVDSDDRSVHFVGWPSVLLRTGPCMRGAPRATPNFCPPPAPFMVQRPPQEPEPQPIPPPTKPTRGDAIDTKRYPRGDCNTIDYEKLNDAVERFCHGKDGTPHPSSCQSWPLALWSKDQLRMQAERWEKCLKARQERENKCFRGGNTGHIIQINDVINALAWCWWRWREHGRLWPSAPPPAIFYDREWACDTPGQGDTFPESPMPTA